MQVCPERVSSANFSFRRAKARSEGVVNEARIRRKADISRTPDWERWKNAFIETGDPSYLTFILGKSHAAAKRYPECPPSSLTAWALEQCQQLFERDNRAVEPRSPIKRPGPPGYPDDGDLLDRIADLRLRGLNLHAAASKVVANNPDPSNVSRLTRLWQEEEKASPTDGEGFSNHKRIARAYQRRFEALQNQRRG